MGSDSDGDEHKSLATLVAVAIAAFAKHRDTNTTRVDIRRLRHVSPLLMHEIDGSEGVDDPPPVKRTRRVFPRPTYKASSACALRCSLTCSGPRTCARMYVVEP